MKTAVFCRKSISIVTPAAAGPSPLFSYDVMPISGIIWHTRRCGDVMGMTMRCFVSSEQSTPILKSVQPPLCIMPCSAGDQQRQPGDRELPRRVVRPL
uniref:MIP21821p n=1 Tax=Drosophila melanogaster TaxID=7227 RepID=D5AEN2_DROME|nr:MIP21821p [Drosophila melanogaster]